MAQDIAEKMRERQNRAGIINETHRGFRASSMSGAKSRAARLFAKLFLVLFVVDFDYVTG